MQSNQFPNYPSGLITSSEAVTVVSKCGRFRSSLGEFCIYAINAERAREEFKRLRPTAVILNVTRNS